MDRGRAPNGIGHLMILLGLVRKKRDGIKCPENIGQASTWLKLRLH